MKTDTTLFDIYANLGLTEVMKSADVEEFVTDEVEAMLAVSSSAAA